MQILQIDEHLVNVLIKSTRDGLAMANIKPIPTGVSKYFHCRHDVSAIVGFVGSTMGSIMVHASRSCACYMAGQMVNEEFTQLTNDTLDGICEIANIIAGQTKAVLSTTEYKFEKISLPSVIVGTSYSVSHYKGMTTVSVEFEVPGMPILPDEDATFMVSISLMKV